MRRFLPFFAVVPLLACTPKKGPDEQVKPTAGSEDPSAESTPAPPGDGPDPAAREQPPAGAPFIVPEWPDPAPPDQDESCPLVIEPGVRLGPVAIGMGQDELQKTGLLDNLETVGDTTFADVGAQRVRLCGGLVASTWINDIRLAPDCLETKAGPLSRTVPMEDLAEAFGGCVEHHATGGTSADCKGGVALGYGMGDFLIVRVLRDGDSVEDDCAAILDDGHLQAIDDEMLAKFVEDVANLSELSGFWHVTEADRKPLRVLLPPELRDRHLEPFRQFGQEMVYLDAPSDLPHLEFTSIRLSETRAELRFRYAVEGVVGRLKYRKRYETWTQTDVKVVEQ